MAVGYVMQKCTSCPGTKLEYVKELNAWRCLYCGTIIERQEQVDTMFTIKNVVRQALLDVAYTRMDSALNNLVECQKIDSRYVGTIIAEIAYAMNMIIHGDISQSEQRNMLATIKKHLGALNTMGETPTEEEIILYDFFDSSEIIGLLILVYDSLNATERRDFIYQYFNASEVYSLELNTDLINYSLKKNDYEMFDKIITNVDNIDTRKVLKLILDKYPDVDQKKANVVMLSEVKDSVLSDDNEMIENYIENSSDRIATKLSVATSFINTVARPSIECLMKNIISKLDKEEEIEQIFNVIINKSLIDVEIYTILDFAITDCADNVCIYILQKFVETKQFVDFSYKYFNAILSRNSSAEIKKKLVELGLAFNVSDKVKELFVSSYLCDVEDSPENRKILIPYLLSLIDMLSTNSVERYLLKCNLDIEIKHEIVKMIFDMKINRSFLHNTLNSYIKMSEDSFEVKKEIINILISAGLRVSVDAVLELLYQKLLSAEERINILRQFKNKGLCVDDITNAYLSDVKAEDFETHVFSELISSTSSITEKCFVRYVLEIKDLDAAKIGHITKMVNLCYSDMENIRCIAYHNGIKITCNIIQGYILSAMENESTAISILTILKERCRNINTEIEVQGSYIKFKKYIKMQKGNLDSKTAKLCEVCAIL